MKQILRKRSALATGVLAAVVTAVLGTGAALRAQAPTPEADAIAIPASAPRSFFFPKSEWDLPSWWVQVSPTEYRERYEPGAGLPDNILRAVGRATVNGAPGTLVYRPDVAVFVPDRDTGATHAGLLWNGDWKEKWRVIEDVE
jgi:hypothetical protein